MERWKEYFYDESEVGNNVEENDNKEKLEGTENTPTLEEVTEAIRYIKKRQSTRTPQYKPRHAKRSGKHRNRTTA